MPPNQLILGKILIRISLYHICSSLTANCHQFGISDKICHLQFKGQTALLRALQIARPAKPQIFFGNAEAIRCFGHDSNATARCVGEFMRCHQDAIASVCATPNSAPQLMQLGKTKAVGIPNNLPPSSLWHSVRSLPLLSRLSRPISAFHAP